ncbi:MAG TPA: ABC transporter ATP-binding protein, partial [Candidatus Caccomorpha excrementavium]|nr:ABC transporter ATP-binding protein [Candidatus Caccomorpha excrementavium]
HSLPQVKSLCNRAIILEKGRLVADGGIAEVAELYEKKIEG